MFSLDKLKVYDKALANAASLAQRSRSWDKRHAVTDQLLRASESFVLNLAEGARLRSAAKRQHVLDYAIGSALECAACLDIAQIKEFLWSFARARTSLMPNRKPAQWHYWTESHRCCAV
jgi:four helix bundle protein